MRDLSTVFFEKKWCASEGPEDKALGRGRPTPFQLWEDLQDLLRRTKDDFDPTTEQARATWMAANVAQLTPG